MSNSISQFIRLTTFLLFANCVMPKAPPSNTLQDIEASSFYIYNSVLRLANSKNNPDFNRLIHDVDRIDVHLLKGQKAKSNFLIIKDRLKNAQYKPLITTTFNGDQRLELLALDNTTSSSYKILLHIDNQYALMELIGTFNLAYINAVSQGNFDFFKNQVFDSNLFGASNAHHPVNNHDSDTRH